MGRLQDERGYTLVIVLLMIVLFLSISTVFIKTSLSHAQQEKSVDNNNHAVVAAEMGIERYSKEVQFELKKEFRTLHAQAINKMKKIEEEVKKYPGNNHIYITCESKVDVEAWINCNINELEKELTNELNNSIQTYLTEVENTKKEIKIDKDLIYSVEKFGFDVDASNDDEIHLILHVVGKKGSSNGKLLTSKLTLPNPNFLDPEETVNVETIVGSKIEKLTDFFPQLSDKVLSKCPVLPVKNMPPCEYTGELTTSYLKKIKDQGFDSSFYIRASKYPNQLNSFSGFGIPLYALEGEIISEPNLNSATNISMYYKGILDLKNTNNHSNHNFFMAEIITLHNNQNVIDNTLIVVGNEKKSVFTAPKIMIGNGSKLCVNLDGVTPNPSDLFKKISHKDYLSVEGTGKIYLYSSKHVEEDTKYNTSNVKYYNDPSKFLSACGVGVSYSTGGSEYITIPSIIDSISDDMDMEVEYKP
ncbi:hypothetical protein [Sporosarcina sp. G11-34]|uniref:hypothetical protein n=1 Tax=Sporosarcina sp. G11-34 TaxID=2849605 RepID=UPI0022A969C7|nr:hypothetical protein [Sporosarcina sp. G11-34]MCZ2259812.1 hypothetical protein [Sporosarcina sp. G11-34]